MQDVAVIRPNHGHFHVASAIFVGSLILGGSLILSAELIKPERYEFHLGPSETKYIIYDRDTGRATTAEFNSKNPTTTLHE